MFLRIFCIFFLTWGFMTPLALAKDGDGSRFRDLFSVLEREGNLDAMMDRSQWPGNDRLTSYLELELLYHPKYKASVKRLSRFIKRWPNHPQIDSVRRFLEIRITRNSQDKEALAWYDKKPPVIRSSQFRYLQLLLDNQRNKEALSLWRSLYTKGVQFPAAINRKSGTFIKKISLAEHEKRARFFLRTGNKKGLRTVLDRLPDDKKWYLLALESAKKSEAKFHSLLKKLTKKNAKSPELWLARIDGLRRHGFRNEAMALLTGREGKYLSKSVQQNQRFRLSRLFALHDETKTAVKLLKPNIQEMGGKLEDSLWQMAWYSHRSGHSKKARDYFMQLGKEAKTVNRRSQGAYWAARTAPNHVERIRWLKKAAAYPESFYGLLALEESQGYIPAFPEEKIPCKPLKDPKLQTEMETLQLFLEAGRNYYIGPEIKRIAGKHGLEMIDQLCLAQHFQAPNHILKTARILKRKGKKYWSGLFPIPNWLPIRGWQVDPSLIWGMARQESLFFHRAKSSADAHGLLQLLPATARQEAKMSGLSPSNSFRLKIPAYNLAVGQSYMKRMLNRFNGDLVLALTAYNAGPSRADRWWKYRRKEEPLTFIENIPIGETRHYVKRVIQGWMVYQLRLYGAASLQSALGADQPGTMTLLMADAR
jgi:soluble lytic murein transglycosylase